MEAPGRKGIAEPMPHHDRGGDDPNHDADGRREVAGRLEDYHDHSHRRPDDRRGNGAHADQSIDQGIDPEIGSQPHHRRAGQAAEQTAEEEGGTEYPAAKPRTYGDRRGDGLCDDQRGQEGQIEARLQLAKDAAMTAAENLGKRQRQATDQQATERRPRPARNRLPPEQGFGPSHPPHQRDTKTGRGDAEPEKHKIIWWRYREPVFDDKYRVRPDEPTDDERPG